MPRLHWLALTTCFHFNCGALEDSVDPVDAHVETVTSALTSCPQPVDSIKYYYPLRDGAEFIDITYMDSPNGLPEYPGGGVMYDYHRDGEASSYDDDIHSTAGVRDFMGNNTVSYDLHNGYDNVIFPHRIIAEGGGLVYPMAPGVVTNIWDAAPQSTIEVTHDNGYKSHYTHLLYGSEQVRAGDRVDTSTPLAQLETFNRHLHFSLHDCEPPPFDEPSYVEVFRADKQLMGRKPLYDSGPSDASDVTIAVDATPTRYSRDAMRFRRGEQVRTYATGQWRTGDIIVVDFVDPNGGFHGTGVHHNTSPGRAAWLERTNAYTLGGSDPVGWWYVRVIVNGKLGVRKYFYVGPAGSPPDASGQVQSAVSVVSSGTDNQRVYYRAYNQLLYSWRWRERFGWTHHNHGIAIAGAPSCVQRSATLVDCFYRGTDGHLHRWASTDGGATGTATDIYAGANASEPMAFSAGPNSLEIAFSDAGQFSILHHDGTAFVKSTNFQTIAGPPSCVVSDATHWFCYARGVSGIVIQFGVTDNGATVNVGYTNLTLENDVHATLTPRTLDQKFEVVLTTKVGNAMQRHTRIHYNDGIVRGLVQQQNLDTMGVDVHGPGMLAPELTTVPRCGVRPGSTTHECYAANLDHELVRTAWTGTRWLPWMPIAASPIDRQAPSIAATGSDRLDVFYASAPNTTTSTPYQRTQSGNLWTAELLLAAHDATFAPGCVARTGNKLDCFWVTSSGSISRRTYAGGVWGTPVATTATAASAVSAVAMSATAVTALYLDTGGNLVERALGDSGWSGSPVVVGKPAGTTLVDAPGCTPRMVLLPNFQFTTAIDCFARTASNTLVMITKGSSWGAWSVVPGAQPRSAPAALSQSPGANDVFFRSIDNNLVHMTRASSTWTTEYLGGAIASAPSCAKRSSPARVDCVAQGFRTLPQDVVHYSYQASIGWTLQHQLATGLANLALGRPTQQSTEYGPNPAPASRAVDGNLDGNFNHGSVTHTNATLNPWWQVDLGATRNVDHVQVFNRIDAAQDRLNGFTLQVSTNGITWTTPPGFYDFERTNPAFPGTFIPVKAGARYVRIQVPGTQYLHIAEVMVMGKEQQ